MAALRFHATSPSVFGTGDYGRSVVRPLEGGQHGTRMAALAQKAARDEASFADFQEQVLPCERSARDEHKRDMSLKWPPCRR